MRQHAGNGKLVSMQGRVAQGNNTAAGATRRVLRLFLLLGVALAAYLALSLLDHAARADDGNPVRISGKEALAGVTGSTMAKVSGASAPKAKVAKKAQAPKVSSASAPKVKVAKKAQAPKVSSASVPKAKVAEKVQALKKVRAPKRVVDRTIREVRAVSDVVRDTATPVVKAATTRPPDMQAKPKAQTETQPKPKPKFTQPVALPDVEIAAPVAVAPPPSAPAARPGQDAAPSRPATGLSTVVEQQPPPPAPRSPGHPTDRSASSTGQARDAGGGHTPAAGICSSPWHPEVVGSGPRHRTDHFTRGRTVRYAGPPS